MQKAMWKKQREKKQSACKHKIITYRFGKNEHSGSWWTLLNTVWVSDVPTVEEGKQRLEQYHQQGSGSHRGGLWEQHFQTFWFLLFKEQKGTYKGGWGRATESSARLMRQNRQEIRRKGVTHSWFCCVNAVRQPRRTGSRQVLRTSLLLVIRLSNSLPVS